MAVKMSASGHISASVKKTRSPPRTSSRKSCTSATRSACGGVADLDGKLRSLGVVRTGRAVDSCSVNVLVQTEDVVGATMAGPGIRYWELSRRLAERHPVTLAT